MSDKKAPPELANHIDCTPRPGYCSHLGVLQGCMDRLGVDVDPAWLYGVTGYAFMINIPRGVCCSGPQAWDWHRICDRTPNVGIDTSQYVLSNKKLPDFAAKKERAIALTREQFAAGVPLYGVEFGYPEFYMINGTSDEGFTFVHKYGHANTYRTWKDFGMMDVGILFVCAVRKSTGKADDRKAIADALDFALAVGHAAPGYVGTENPGLSAYDAWVAGLADSAALREGPWNHPDGTTYNAGAWHDCRTRRAVPAHVSGEAGRQAQGGVRTGGRPVREGGRGIGAGACTLPVRHGPRVAGA